MREIEFRAFDKETGKMHYLINKPYDEKTVDDELIVQIDCTGAKGYTKNKYIGDCLMQFTGLLDKNGKKIFEGDLLKAKSLVVKIFYDKGAFYFCKNLPILLNAMNQDLEIIGNIFENPELLER